MEINIDDKIRFIVLYRDASLKKIQRIIGGSMRTLKHLESEQNLKKVGEGKKNRAIFSKNRK